MIRKYWTHEELILAFSLYCKTPFGKIHNRNPNIIELARLLNRSPSAVSWKLANFARLDPALQERHISGAKHGNKEEQQIWDQFHHDWEQLAFKSEQLLAQYRNISLQKSLKMYEEGQFEIGKERESLVKIRVKQSFFRQMILASYSSRCCITGLSVPELLNASHIVPWAVDPKNRLNPRNGLCLNSLHDKAFDRGFITITTDFRVKISTKLKIVPDQASLALLLKFDNIKITLPEKFIPDTNFLAFHNEKIFLK